MPRELSGRYHGAGRGSANGAVNDTLCRLGRGSVRIRIDRLHQDNAKAESSEDRRFMPDPFRQRDVSRPGATMESDKTHYYGLLYIDERHTTHVNLREKSGDPIDIYLRCAALCARTAAESMRSM